MPPRKRKYTTKNSGPLTIVIKGSGIDVKAKLKSAQFGQALAEAVAGTQRVSVPPPPAVGPQSLNLDFVREVVTQADAVTLQAIMEIILGELDRKQRRDEGEANAGEANAAA